MKQKLSAVPKAFYIHTRFLTQKYDSDAKGSIQNNMFIFPCLFSGAGFYFFTKEIFTIKKKDINVISIVLDAPADIINTLSGKIGMLDGISSKVVCSKS